MRSGLERAKMMDKCDVGATVGRNRTVRWVLFGMLVLGVGFGGRPATAQSAPKPQANAANPATARPKDRVDKLLESVDTSAFSGAELDMEIVGDQVILRGNESDLDMIELLIALLEDSVEAKVMEIVRVTEKDAKDIASTMEPAMQNLLLKPNQREELRPTITALSSTILLVSALPDQIEFIIEAIHQVDEAKEALPVVGQLVFLIKNRRATDVAEQLTDIVKKMQERQGQSGAKYEIQIIANDANNSVMVLAPESERAKIKALIDEIDVEPVKGWGEIKLTLFPLQHSKASEMADVISDLLQSDAGRESAEEFIRRLQISKVLPNKEIIDLPPIDLQKPTRIIADVGTNSLIVATVAENVGPLGELIRMMDDVPMAEEVKVKFFPLRYADAETMAQTLNDMVSGGGELTQDPDGSGDGAVPVGEFGRALVYNVGIYTDVRTNTLVVTGREDHLHLVETAIGQLDRPGVALKYPLRFIKLARTDATSVGDVITEVFDRRMEALQATETGKIAPERERVFVSVDTRSNSLIVSCSEENFAEITGIVRQLDVKPVRLFDRMRVVPCGRLAAVEVKTKIDEIWSGNVRSDDNGELYLPIVVVDERSNSLIVASSVEDHEQIVKLLEVLETQPLIDDMRIFNLKYADTQLLATMLTQLFDGLAGGSTAFVSPTILADPRSNALIAAGSRDAIERMADLVTRLDVEAGPLTTVFKVYPLDYASAAQLAARVQELFDARAEGQELAGSPVVILPDEVSNSLVCAATRDDHLIIVDLLKLLDKPSSLARQFSIFPLKTARATTVADSLESLFTGTADSGSRLDAIATATDERTNSIIVWASPTQMVNISEVIERLDTSRPAVEKMVRVIQLKQALAEDFADLFRRAVVGEDAGTDTEQAEILAYAFHNADGSHKVRKLLRQDIVIEPDPRTNSLIVKAPVDSMDLLEAIVKDFDAIRPIRSELRLFPLVNSDAEAMADQLTDLFQADSAGDGESGNNLIFGRTIGEFDVASVGQELRFTADPRTNTLIAAGAEVDLRMVEELIQYLDSQLAEDRVTEVYAANYLDASDIASAVQSFNQQEQDVLGEITDAQANMRRMERQISVESVGAEAEGSSRLIVGTSRQKYQDTMNMIHELDRPEPQVRISMLIAEVSLTDNLELGIEFAGQELDFTRNAAVGPNGVINGSEFDFVGGINLGVPRSPLGFNFTVTGEDFSFILHALQSESRLEVLSSPTLVVRNGDEGKMTIADQVPFVESSQINDTGSTNSVVGREDVGIVLTATPRVSPDGYVTIELVQEISSFAGENLQLTEGVSSPIFSTRELQTNVTIRDGETVVIGGLITTRKSTGETGVPILSKLPLIGRLFRTTNSSEQKTELLIVMTVDVLRTDEDTRQMSVQQRDKGVLTDSILQSPLMEGLRILPDEKLLGPKARAGDSDGKTPSPRGPEKRELYGPTPKTYGPPIRRSKATATAELPVYGPQIVRNTTADESN